MIENIEKFLSELSESFMSGNVDAVFNHVSLPLAIYFGDDMILVRTRHELRDLTESYVGEIRRNVMTKSQPVLDDVIVSDDGAITAFTTARLLDDSGGTVALSRAKYFIRQTGTKFTVEMVQHSQVPISDDLLHAPLAKMKV